MHLEQLPLNLYELYSRRLRGQSAAFSQQGCQSNEDDRSVEVQTDETETREQEMQFQFGDDCTQFENLLAAMREGEVQESPESSTQATAHLGVSLPRFLRHSTPVMEALLVEGTSTVMETHISSRGLPSAFEEQSWVRLQAPLQDSTGPLTCNSQVSGLRSKLLTPYFIG